MKLANKYKFFLGFLIFPLLVTSCSGNSNLNSNLKKIETLQKKYSKIDRFNTEKRGKLATKIKTLKRNVIDIFFLEKNRRNLYTTSKKDFFVNESLRFCKPYPLHVYIHNKKDVYCLSGNKYDRKVYDFNYLGKLNKKFKKTDYVMSGIPGGEGMVTTKYSLKKKDKQQYFCFLESISYLSNKGDLRNTSIKEYCDYRRVK